LGAQVTNPNETQEFLPVPLRKRQGRTPSFIKQ